MTGRRLTLTELAGQAVATVEEAAALLGIARSSAFQAIHRGELPHIQIGRRILVPVPELLSLLGADTRALSLQARDHDRPTPPAHHPLASPPEEEQTDGHVRLHEPDL